MNTVAPLFYNPRPPILVPKVQLGELNLYFKTTFIIRPHILVPKVQFCEQLNLYVKNTCIIRQFHGPMHGL